MRTCVGCLEVRGKKELIRVVRTPAGSLDVDPTGKKPGRGAYLCANAECLEKALKGRRLENALGVKIDSDTIEKVRARLSAPPPDRR
jgi:predicted RNA-binding protein YlxR (DUF448 family)